MLRKLRRIYRLSREYYNNWVEWVKHDRKHLTHKVIVSIRFYIPWLRSVIKERTAFADESPWITFEARHFLDRILKPEFMVFEYGAGGSTLYFAQRVNRLITVEHHETWYEQVKAKLAEGGRSNWTLLLKLPEKAPSNHNADDRDPLSYASSDADYLGQYFHSYVTAIDQYPDKYFDLVVVDGRARVSCIYHARAKVKEGGYLLLDNSDRESYQNGKQLLEQWQPFVYAGPVPYNLGFTETTIWKNIR